MNAEKATKEVKIYPPVNCKNDSMMVREGIRVPKYYQDPEWHYKTPEERAELARYAKIKDLRPSGREKKKPELLQFRIVVHLKNLKKEPQMKTTYSDMLFPSQVLNWLDMTFANKTDEVKCIYYHGKPYIWGPASK